MLYKKLLTICILLVLGISAIGCGNNTSYDYETDQKNRIITYSSEEDESFSQVKSSKDYKLKPFCLILIDGVLKGSPENYPFKITSIECKQNGIFVELEFNDSGFIKNFSTAVKVGNSTVFLKQSLIDCSNTVRLYAKVNNGSTTPSIFKFSNFYWETAKVKTIGLLDFSQDTYIADKCKIKKHSTNQFTIKKKNVMNLSIKNDSYNTISYKIHTTLFDLFRNLKNTVLDGYTPKFYLIIDNQHKQINSCDFYLYQRKSGLLQADDEITQIKICIEKEVN